MPEVPEPKAARRESWEDLSARQVRGSRRLETRDDDPQMGEMTTGREVATLIRAPSTNRNSGSPVGGDDNLVERLWNGTKFLLVRYCGLSKRRSLAQDFASDLQRRFEITRECRYPE